MVKAEGDNQPEGQEQGEEQTNNMPTESQSQVQDTSNMGSGSGDQNQATLGQGQEEGQGTQPQSSQNDKEPVPEVKKMRAVCITSFCGVKGVKCMERPQPPPLQDGQVLVQVKISGVNFYDLLLRMGVLDASPHPIPSTRAPLTLGSEIIGTITQIGSNVTKVKEGDLVFAFLQFGGGWAEYASLDENLIFPVTHSDIPLDTLASTFSYLVAYLLLQRAGEQALVKGKKILIHSAGGSIGLAIKELANLRGLEVIGICSKEKHDKLEGFKALLDRTIDYTQEIKKLCPDGLDAVFDCQGGDDCANGISLLAPGGTYILFGNANNVTGDTKGIFSFAKNWWNSVEKISPARLFDENKQIAGLNVRKLIKSKREIVEKGLEVVWDLMAKRKLEPIKDSHMFHFEEMGTAMQKMHERKNIGKILVSVDIPPPAPEPTPTPVDGGNASVKEGNASPTTNGTSEPTK